MDVKWSVSDGAFMACVSLLCGLDSATVTLGPSPLSEKHDPVAI